MTSTTYYPFNEKYKNRLMPLRFGVLEGESQDRLKSLREGVTAEGLGNGLKWEVFEDQMDLLKLPRVYVPFLLFELDPVLSSEIREREGTDRMIDGRKSNTPQVEEGYIPEHQITSSSFKTSYPTIYP